ncbi:MAG: hypothetical protein ACE5HF_08235 [Gemmatimonadota bacterium]
MSRLGVRVGLAGALVLGAPALPPPGSADAAPAAPRPTRCELPGRGPTGVRVPFRPTRHARGARGEAQLVFARSPFGVAVEEDGRYRYDVTIQLANLRPRAGRTYVAWAATPDLDHVLRLGPVDSDLRVEGRLSWNKFLLFVTLEPDPSVERWTGPVVLTAMSPSGRMHTMAGHGIFERHTALC